MSLPIDASFLVSIVLRASCPCVINAKSREPRAMNLSDRHLVRRISVSILTVVICCQVAHAQIHSSKPISGRVVDANTGQPLEGVAVVGRRYGRRTGGMVTGHGPGRARDDPWPDASSSRIGPGARM
jgi:hypothetical protein